jgi:hypothetical protein
MNNWFIPEPDEFPSQRALLNLQLGKAIRAYRERVVPGIAGVWFVRQLSWAVAGITLAENVHYHSSVIANSIEALAGKLEWKNEENFSGRGLRAFNRDGNEMMDFKNLSNKDHYVQITYRMSTVNALVGLGLADGRRFNSMKLTPVGDRLAEVFLSQKKGGKGGKSIEKALIGWIRGEDEIRKLDGLGRNWATEDEKEIVINRLYSDVSDPMKYRQNLISAFGRYSSNFPGLTKIKKELKDSTQVDDIETSEAFDKMLTSAQESIHICAGILEMKKQNRVTLLVNEKILKLKLDSLEKHSQRFLRSKGYIHPSSKEFAIEQKADLEERLVKLIQRDGNILVHSGNKVCKGPLFDHYKEIDTTESTEDDVGTENSSTVNKVRQLFSLLGDCK